MPLILDPFMDNNAFTMASLTGAINIVPNKYSRIMGSGIFKTKGVTTRQIGIEEKHGVLTLIQTSNPDAPPAQNKAAKRKMRYFEIPHIAIEDAVLPSDYAGVRAFGTENQLVGPVQAMNDRLEEMKNKIDITKEHLFAGALKGNVLDADGSVIYNLYTEFGITQKTVNFALTTGTTKVATKILAAKRHIEANLQGEIATGFACWCGPDFFDAFVTHASVEAAYAGYSAAQERIGGDNRKGFNFAGVTFSEYVGSAYDAGGTERVFIPKDGCIMFPTGTLDVFTVFYAPAQFNETVNTIGIEYYARQAPRKYNRGTDVYAESNPLPMCKRPGVLVTGTKS